MVSKTSKAFSRRVLIHLDDQAYEGLRVKFSVDKTVSKALNKAKIEVWNLPDSFEQFIGSRDLRVQLLAGYEGNVQLLFEGNPVKGGIETQRDGGEYRTKIEASDGLRVYQTSTISLSTQQQETFRQVLDRVLDQTDLSRGEIQIPSTKRMTQGVALHGSTRKILDRLASAYHADWSIQNGSLNFLPRDETANRGPLFSPELNNILEIGRKDDGRLRLKTLLDHTAPGDRFKVKDTDRYDGVYKVQSSTYKGDVGYESAFYTTFEARAL